MRQWIGRAEALANTLHGKHAFGNLADVACQACHGSVERHLEDPTDEANQPRISDLGPRVISDT